MQAFLALDIFIPKVPNGEDTIIYHLWPKHMIDPQAFHPRVSGDNLIEKISLPIDFSYDC